MNVGVMDAVGAAPKVHRDASNTPSIAVEVGKLAVNVALEDVGKGQTAQDDDAEEDHEGDSEPQWEAFPPPANPLESGHALSMSPIV